MIKQNNNKQIPTTTTTKLAKQISTKLTNTYKPDYAQNRSYLLGKISATKSTLFMKNSPEIKENIFQPSNPPTTQDKEVHFEQYKNEALGPNYNIYQQRNSVENNNNNDILRTGRQLIKQELEKRSYTQKCTITLGSLCDPLGNKNSLLETNSKAADINKFITELNKYIPSIDQMKLEIKKKIEYTQQYFTTQIQNADSLFTQMVNKINEEKKFMIERYTQEQQYIVRQYQKELDEQESKEITSLQMKNDIYKNYEKIINCIEIQPFAEIIKQYYEKLHVLQEITNVDLTNQLNQPVDAETIFYNFDQQFKNFIGDNLPQKPSSFVFTQGKENFGSFAFQAGKENLGGSFTKTQVFTSSKNSSLERKTKNNSVDKLTKTKGLFPHDQKCQRKQKSENSIFNINTDHYQYNPAPDQSILERVSQNNSKKYQQVVDKIMVNQMKKNEYYSKLFKQYSLDIDNQMQKRIHFKKYSDELIINFIKSDDMVSSGEGGKEQRESRAELGLRKALKRQSQSKGIQ